MKHSTKTKPIGTGNQHVATRRRCPDVSDEEALSILTRRLRLAGASQFAQALWSDDLRRGRSFVERMERSGLVETVTVLAHPVIALSAPLARWQPRLPAPDLAGVSYRARHRWGAPSQTTIVLIATEGAAASIGGCAGRQPRLSEATHDLHVAQVYFQMLRDLPTRAGTWEGETQAAARSTTNRGCPAKLPDAMVRDGVRRTAIEFVGEYPPSKLEAFHRFCLLHEIGYELW
ncbi:MAG: hypothetical protein IT434_01925 [Phycisphaerales bacterium]|nr:hypothetical protein [Phycisphaerales bacterium]